MARELGVISSVQSVELAINTEGLTLGFDATTQEGVHINSIHFTTVDKTLVVAIDQLAGGTAEDYAEHICDAVDELAIPTSTRLTMRTVAQECSKISPILCLI